MTFTVGTAFVRLVAFVVVVVVFLKRERFSYYTYFSDLLLFFISEYYVPN